ncbi:DNA polymerase III subunit tau [bacterium BMS3Abin14]|nr:DNA polymerase III subunit tau [bacterium BMS3Abin14]
MIAEHLGHICGSEGIDISPDSLHRIAVAAEGSLRDSQSLLDQIISYAGNMIAEEDVNTVLGTLDRGMLFKILDASFSGSAGDALGTMGEMIDNGADPMRIVLDLIGLLRALLLAAELEKPESVLDLPEGEMETIKQLSTNTNRELLRVRFALMARAEERMRRSPQPRFHLELAVVHMARAEEIASLISGGSPPAAPPTARSAETGTAPRPAASEPDKTHATETVGKPSSESVAPPAFAAIETPEETWESLVAFINGKMPNIGSILEHLVCLQIAGDELVIGGVKGELYIEILKEKEKRAILKSMVDEFFSRDINVRFTEMEAIERARNHNIVEKNEIRESDLARKIRKETLEHAAIKNAIEIFNGKVERVRVLSARTPETLEIEEKEEDV